MQASLYERLGGIDAITAVVEDFAGRTAGDSRINGKFARTDLDRLKRVLVDQCVGGLGWAVHVRRAAPQETIGGGRGGGEVLDARWWRTWWRR